jgi:hypothetical protein
VPSLTQESARRATTIEEGETQMHALPGEETLVATWRALTRLSEGAQVGDRGRSLTVVFPSWEPLSNAILRAPSSAGAADEATADLAGVYEAARTG